MVGLVIPTGYSFNLDGTSIYLTMAAVFIAQACDISLTLQQELTILAVLLLTSKGAAGVVGSGFVTLAATLSTVGQIPVAGVALILGIDRFMSEARAITNLIGNGVATVVISRWENELDVPRMEAVLAGREVAPIDDVIEPAALPSPAAALRDVPAADTSSQGATPPSWSRSCARPAAPSAVRSGRRVRRKARSASSVARTARVSGPSTDSCCGPTSRPSARRR